MSHTVRTLPLCLCLFASACLQRGIDTPQLYTLEVAPQNVPADNVSAATATLLLANFQFPPSVQVVFQSSDASTFIEQPIGPIAGNKYIAKLRSAVPGRPDISAWVHDGNRMVPLVTALATFTALQPSAAASTLTAVPSVVSADGLTNATLSVQAFDSFQHAVVAAPVTLAVSGADNLVANPQGVTDASGRFTTTLASTRAEDKVVTATIAGVAVSTTVTFSGTSPSLATSSLIASPSSILDDGVAASSVTLTLQDAHANALEGQAITFVTSAANAALSVTTGLTNASGTLSTQIKSTRASNVGRGKLRRPHEIRGRHLRDGPTR